jgi:antirestriction protein ArdC
MTEKNQAEQNAAQRQKELLAEALEKARANGGAFLNAEGKTAPRLYPGGNAVSPFNSLILSLHSERNGYKTNLYMPFPEAKKRGDSVQAGEKGVPFVWYRWNEFRSKSDPDRKITREEYNGLDAEQKKGYSPVRDREIRMLFNIEQTTLPLSDKEAFTKAVSEYGPAAERGVSGPEDKKIRMEVNRFLQNVAANLVPIRKDGTGIAHYDSARDIIHLPAQKHFPSYAEYVQEAMRMVVTATGHPQRTARPGFEVEGRIPSEKAASRERLVVEMASAVKMNQLGLPSRLSPESLTLIDGWEKSLEENPRMIDALEADVSNALNMVAKAERGEKIELKPMPERKEERADMVKASIVMVQDDAGKWALYIKPESEKGFAIYPDKEDVGRFFSSAKKNGGQPDDAFRQGMAQRYYMLASLEPSRKVDIFSTTEKDIDLSVIEKVNIVRTKGEAQEEGKKTSRILCYPTFKGMEKMEPREVSPSQWQRMWLAEDKAEYKKNLAATLYADVLRQRQQNEAEKQEEQKRMNSPEQKAKEEREEKQKEAITRAGTAAVAGLVAGGIVKDQQQEEQSRGLHR